MWLYGLRQTRSRVPLDGGRNILVVMIECRHLVQRREGRRYLEFSEDVTDRLGRTGVAGGGPFDNRGNL